MQLSENFGYEFCQRCRDEANDANDVTLCDTEDICVFTYEEPFQLAAENAMAVEIYYRVNTISPDMQYEFPQKKNDKEGLEYRLMPTITEVYNVIDHLPDVICSTSMEREILVEKILHIYGQRLQILKDRHG